MKLLQQHTITKLYGYGLSPMKYFIVLLFLTTSAHNFFLLLQELPPFHLETLYILVGISKLVSILLCFSIEQNKD